MIYFIKNRTFVKIGYTSNLNRRLNELQIGSPKQLKLIGLMEGDYQTEAGLHEAFKKHRVKNTEWFAMKGELGFCMESFRWPLRKHEQPKTVKQLLENGLQLAAVKASRKKIKRAHKLRKKIEFHQQRLKETI